MGTRLCFCTDSVTAVTAVVVDGVLSKWPKGMLGVDVCVGRWTKEDFCGVVSDVKTPQHVFYRDLCSMKTVIERDAAWTTMEFYIKRMERMG